MAGICVDELKMESKCRHWWPNTITKHLIVVLWSLWFIPKHIHLLIRFSTGARGSVISLAAA